MKKDNMLINYIWGKLIFSLLGYALLQNWAGIVAGFTLGFIVDILLAKAEITLDSFTAIFNIFGSKKKLYRKTLFMQLGYLAKADGVVSPQEIAVAESFFTQLNLNAKQRQSAIEAFQAGKFAGAEINQKLNLLKSKFKHNDVLSKEFLDASLQICFADTPPSTEQILKLKTILPNLNLQTMELDRAYERILLKQPLDQKQQRSEYAQFKQALQSSAKAEYKNTSPNKKETKTEKDDFKSLWQNAWDLHKKQQAQNKERKAKDDAIKQKQKAEAQKQRAQFEREFNEKTKAREKAKEETKRQEQFHNSKQSEQHKFNDNFGFNQGYNQQGKNSANTANYHEYHILVKACETLGINPNANASEVKTSYRKLISKYHPDKLASQRLTPAARIAAKHKMQAIQEAFETIKKIKGI